MRNGTFSSSSIWKLATSGTSKGSIGADFYKYVNQVQNEIDLQRSINKEANGRSNTWGTFMEKYINDKNILDMSEYVLVSEERLKHPILTNWTGMPDVRGVKIKSVGDAKCPYSLEVFCAKIKALNKGVDEYKKQFKEDYWQLISNSILMNENGIEVEYIQPIIFCPYQSQLDSIRTYQLTDKKFDNMNWLQYAKDSELPYLVETGKYKNLNIFTFPINKEDVEFLTERVVKAINMLEVKSVK